MREYRKSAEEWFDKREEVGGGDEGNKRVVDQIKDGAEARLDEDGTLPKTAPPPHSCRKPTLARKAALEAAYTATIQGVPESEERRRHVEATEKAARRLPEQDPPGNTST